MKQCQEIKQNWTARENLFLRNFSSLVLKLLLRMGDWVLCDFSNFS